MPLFKLSSDIMPTIYQKDDTEEATIERFKVGFATLKELAEDSGSPAGKPAEHYLHHASFKCEEMTPEKFVEELPEEFQIDDDTSF